jgi:hypothetical protein
LLFYFVRVPSPSNNFQLKVCNLFKGKVAFGFFCQKTEGVLSFSFITSTHPVCFAATPPFQGGEYPPRLLRSHLSLAGWGMPTPSASQPPLPFRAGINFYCYFVLFCFVRVPSPSNNFELKVCNLFKRKVAFGFFC